LNSSSCSLEFEEQGYNQGFKYIAGIDEAGRGALCGPVVAAAVVLPVHTGIQGVDDSKKLTSSSRDDLYAVISKQAVGIGIGLSRAFEIDRINILNATKVAMKRAIRRLPLQPDYLLIDAVKLDRIDIPQKAIIKGDQLSVSIAAASIVAKVIRDRIMTVWGNRYPVYDLQSNKGYATVNHVNGLNQFGPSAIHRMTFKKVYDCRVLFPEADFS
jgi:ribonuclease HII